MWCGGNENGFNPCDTFGVARAGSGAVVVAGGSPVSASFHRASSAVCSSSTSLRIRVFTASDSASNIAPAIWQRRASHFSMGRDNSLLAARRPGDSYTQREETADIKSDNMLSSSFAAVVGSLYLAVVSRPDIVFTVTRASQYTSNPVPAHWSAIKRIIGI
ncbi:hypothetical protein K438DRAFT_1780792 [Mycena galopus ATCC 62051]|nr:hypothetical protein K438DRAFT_1780792 [Mycena galopus ATCC 62051]